MGTPQELTDENGNVVWANYEFAWGGTYQRYYKEQSLNGTPIDKDHLQPLKFQGQFFDPETSLHYNRFRYYDSDVGMFIQRDPIGLLGGVNVFAYAPNPIHWIDVLGLIKKQYKGGLNWGAINNGESRQEHVNKGHAQPNPNKPKQSIFLKSPIKTINQAWKKAMKKNNKCTKSSSGDTDEYIVDMRKPIGYDRDTGEIMSKVIIFVKKNTNKIITGYPTK